NASVTIYLYDNIFIISNNRLKICPRSINIYGSYECDPLFRANYRDSSSNYYRFCDVLAISYLCYCHCFYCTNNRKCFTLTVYNGKDGKVTSDSHYFYFTSKWGTRGNCRDDYCHSINHDYSSDYFKAIRPKTAMH